MPTEESDGEPNVAISFGIAARFRTLVKDQGTTKPDDLGIVTAAETSVEERLIKASGVDFPHLADMVAVTKLWMHCRGRVDRVRCRRIQARDVDKLDDTQFRTTSKLVDCAASDQTGMQPHSG